MKNKHTGTIKLNGLFVSTIAVRSKKKYYFKRKVKRNYARKYKHTLRHLMIFSFPPICPDRSNLTYFIRHNSIIKLT